MVRIAWTPAILRKVAPIRGSTLVPARLPSAKVAFDRLAAAMRNASLILDAWALQPGADRGRMAASRAAFAGATPPKRLDLAVQAAACALIGPHRWGVADNAHVNDFVCFWAATEGAPFALRAFVAAHGESTNEPASHESREVGLFAWRGLRLVAANASDAEHAELLAEAEAIQATARAHVRALLAAAFERPDWCAADLAARTEGSWSTWPLAISARSLEEAEQLIELSRARASRHGVMPLYELRLDLLARYGEAATDLIVESFPRSAELERTKALADTLALVATERVARFFAARLATSELGAIAAAYLQAHPEVALAPLASVAAEGKGAAAETARALLKPCLATHLQGATGAADLATTIASLAPAAQALVAEMRASIIPVEEAAPDALPRVLRAPPWTMEVTISPPVVLDLAPLALPESFAWKPGEQEQARNLGGRAQAESPEYLDEIVANIRKVSASEASHSTSASSFARLTRSAFLDVAPWVDVTKFGSWDDPPIAVIVVARHGVAAIPFALRSAAVDPIGAITALRRARSPRVAPLMADAFARQKKAKPLAAIWLASFPEAAAVGLIPPALGEFGAERTSAVNALRFVARAHRAVVEEAALRFGTVAEGAVRALLDHDPLLDLPARLPKLPAFFCPGAFTRPRLANGGKALPLAAVGALGMMLAFSELDPPYAGIDAVKEACDRRSLADFAWDLFEAWLVAGAPPEEAWALRALGHFGDDDCARRLTPLVRAWPGEAAHTRAVVGLDVLTRIGTDVALMHLHGIAQRLKFKALREMARVRIEQIAEVRGMSADELADRIVPDLGLDERGSLALDFGPRTFRVVFDETLKPAVLDDAGTRLADLPKPRQSDDAERARAATERWKALKKDARAIATAQILRLETAMCARRRWPADVFRRFFLEHPLLVHVVRRLVWATYDTDERIVASFRVAEDTSLADENDDAWELPEGARVGLVHRLDLESAQVTAWGQVLADYEVIPPFAQLAREITTPTEAEKTATKLARLVGVVVHPRKVSGLAKRGWRPEPGGVISWYEKALGHDLVACLDFEPGIYTGEVGESREQTLGEVSLAGETPFGALSPIAFSELLCDLETLRR